MTRKSAFVRYLSVVLLTLTLAWQGAQYAYAGDEVAAAPAAAAPAADAGDSTASANKLPDNFLSLMLAGGVIGDLIILLSVVSLALCIEGMVTIKREKLMPDDVLSDIEGALDAGEYEEALDICQGQDCMMTRILGAGLAKMANGFGRMESAMAEEADAQATILFQKISYVNLLAGVAPMLGLFGTVSGMIDAFGEIARKEAPNAKDLAGGIYVALVTTFLGLVVAIPSTTAFVFLRSRVVKMLLVMGVITGEILDRFRPVEEQ